MAVTFIDAALLTIGVYCLWKVFTSKAKAPLPPGPKGLPLLGNIFDMPSEKEWITFTKWSEKWGDIVSVSVLGQPIVVINSMDVAIELLDRRSSINSDRPTIPMGGELVGWKNTTVLLPYGPHHRLSRKLFHQIIGTTSVMERYHAVEEHETRRFLRALLKSPEDFRAHVRKTAGAIILRIAYGYEVKQGEDPFVKLADEATDQFSLSSSPGVFLVNLLPPLAYLPEWFPGAGFQKTAKKWARTLNDMVDLPFQFVKKEMASSAAPVSFVSSLLDQHLEDEKEFDVKWSAASLYSGGADTTVATIDAFILAMSLFPDVQKKAQAELDRVVGTDRLPTFEDREHLPYLNALVLETLRWHAVAPTGVAHRSQEDQFFNGYLIPKNSLIISNQWQMLHDPRVYTNPAAFEPGRFLGDQPERDPQDACFGFGRRICPGISTAFS
ncbi:hypothetical protein HGRIS_012127 [Hohenbuehelia grisea]|uniref:Cytochrome P450 n=1 Tax=Hohenbuehelia grisea TaxID=104357 RepID=A0ABR3IRB8_9AGAR